MKNEQTKKHKELHDEELSVSCQSSLRKHIEVIPSLDLQNKRSNGTQIKDLGPGEVSKKRKSRTNKIMALATCGSSRLTTASHWKNSPV